jgi:hypothetical protein
LARRKAAKAPAAVAMANSTTHCFIGFVSIR